MKIILESSKKKIITMCGSNQFAHHPPVILPNPNEILNVTEKKEEVKQQVI